MTDNYFIVQLFDSFSRIFLAIFCLKGETEEIIEGEKRVVARRWRA
jgi:hypothetical protein